ncbi:MAG: hypothetical protein ABIJ97_06340 [Bacteroidota bacterium]
MKKSYYLIIVCLLGIFFLNSCYFTQSLSDSIYEQNRKKTNKHRPKLKYKEFTPDYKKAYLSNDYLMIYSSNGGYTHKPDRQVVYKYKLENLNDTIFDNSTLTNDTENSKVIFKYDHVKICQDDSVKNSENTSDVRKLSKTFDEMEYNAKRKTLFITEGNLHLVVKDSVNIIYLKNHYKYYRRKGNRDKTYKDYSYSPDFIINSYHLNEKTDYLFTELDTIPVLKQNLARYFSYFYYYYDGYSSYKYLGKNSKKLLLDTVSYYLNQPEYKNGFIADLYGYGAYWAYCRYDQSNKNILLINRFELPQVKNYKEPFIYQIKNGVYNIVTWNYWSLLYVITVPLDIITYPIQFYMVISDPHFSLGY